MSIDSIALDTSEQPILNRGEKIFNYQGGVWLEFESGSGYPGQGQNYYTKGGTVYQTNLRVIYLPVPSLPYLKSFTVPIQNFKEEKFNQPLFGANFFEALIFPVPLGGLTIPGKLKLTFKEGGGFEFNTILKQLKSRISGTTAMEGESLPIYDGSSLANSDQPPPPPPSFSEELPPPEY
ncbi:hypothetical protein HDU92_002315 [Lobulomyces angularis]|nr:hypothetical protein HDU92_002315 [Lobulomyces angularis]